MKIERLALLRYGPFTDCELTLAPDAALHVIYGPNEAGKSSTLAAVADLLFGFRDPRRDDRPVDFLHKRGDLRLGARVRARSGTSLAFRRRVGTRRTLLADADAEQALADDALAPYLGTLGREGFERAFGLDSARLRAGGETMMNPDGEIGAILMEASAGISGLSALRKTLEREADELYGPRKAQRRAFTAAQERYEDAQAAARAATLNAAEWRRLLDAQDAAEMDHRQADMAHRAARDERWRLTQLQQVAPIARRIADAHERLAPHADLCAVPDGATWRLRAALEADRTAAAQLEAAERGERAAAATLSAIAVDEAALAQVDAIDALHADASAHAKCEADRPALEARLAQERQALARLAEGLGLTVDRLRCGPRPADDALQRASEAAVEGPKREEACRSAREAFARSQAALAASDTERLPDLVDPAHAARALDALEDDLAAALREDELSGAVAVLEREVEARRSRLAPPLPDGPPAALPLPSHSLIAEQAAAITALSKTVEDARQRRDTLAAEQRKVAEERAALAEGGDLATPEAIADARQRRDKAIAALDPARGPDQAAFVTAKTDVAQADALADRAIAEADRLAQHKHLGDRLARLTTDVARANSEWAEATDRRKAASQAFAQRFAEAGVVAAEPSAMVEWRREVDALIATGAELDAARDALTACRRTVDRVAAALREIAAELRHDPSPLPLRALRRDVKARLEAVASEWQDRRDRETVRAQLIATHEADRERLEEAEAAFATWRREMAAAAAALGLRDEASAGEVGTVVGLWQRVPERLSALAAAEAGLEEAQRSVATFEDRARSLGAALDLTDLLDGPIGPLVTELRARAVAAREAAAERTRARTALAQARTARETAQTARREAGTALAGELNALPPAEPEALALRLEDRDAARQNLEDERKRLSEVDPNAHEPDVLKSLESFDAAAVAARLEALALETERADKAERAAYVVLEDARREVALRTGADGAEEPVFRRQSAVREMGDVARRWAVTKIAAQLIAAALEAKRKAHGAPVIDRAGALFADLTEGAFDGLTQRFGEEDSLDLLATRNGEAVPRQYLSEGTADQLFLALRLAFVEDYATRNEPTLFMADDVFASFDEARTAAGLHALSTAAGRYQPIVFTHHRHVVEIARARLGSAADIIDL